MNMMNLECIMIVIFTIVNLRQNVHGGTIKNTTLQPGELSHYMSNSSVGELTYKDRLDMTNASGFSELESLASFQMRDTASRNVAFMATLAQNLKNPSTGQRVIFNRENLDTTNSYNPNTGIFNVPENGVYYISLTATNTPQNAIYHYLHLYIKKNGVSVGYLFLDDNARYWLRRNEVVLLHLNAGDNVYVQVDVATHPCTLVGGDFTTHFQGFLIFPD